MKRYRYLFFISNTITPSQMARRIAKASCHLFISHALCWDRIDPLAMYIEDSESNPGAAMPVCAVLFGGKFLEYCKQHPIRLERIAV